MFSGHAPRWNKFTEMGVLASFVIAPLWVVPVGIMSWFGVVLPASVIILLLVLSVLAACAGFYFGYDAGYRDGATDTAGQRAN